MPKLSTAQKRSKSIPEPASRKAEKSHNPSRRSTVIPTPAIRESSFVVPPFRPKKDDNIILVMGASGSGKSTFIKTVTGQEAAAEGHGLRSFTQEVRPFRCLSPSLSDTVLVDTPGFADTARSDADVLEIISTWLTDLTESGGAITGLLFFYRISDVRMSGQSLRNLRMFEKLCGEEAFPSVVLVSTMWDAVAQEVAIKRESELTQDFWRNLILRGARVSRFDRRSASSARGIIDILRQKPKTILAIQREIVFERKRVLDTAAGTIVADALARLTADHRKTLAALEAEAQSDFVRKDAALRQALAEEKLQYRRLLEEGIAAQKRLAEMSPRPFTHFRTPALTDHSPKCWERFFIRRFRK